jgi:hypothetical protein
MKQADKDRIDRALYYSIIWRQLRTEVTQPMREAYRVGKDEGVKIGWDAAVEAFRDGTLNHDSYRDSGTDALNDHAVYGLA